MLMAAGPRLIFVDANVLIAAARGTQEISAQALALLSAPTVRFASSPLVRLEVLPKPLYYRRATEAAFYDAFFAGVVVWAEIDDALVNVAFIEAARVGLSAIDALHLAAASASGADEFITVERLEKPLHRTRLVPVRTLHP